MKNKLLSIILSLSLTVSMIPMMTVTSLAADTSTDIDATRDFIQSALAAVTLDTTAKKNAANKVSSAFSTALSKNTAAAVALRKTYNNIVDAIGLSRLDEQAAAIASLGVTALDSIVTISKKKAPQNDTGVVEKAVIAAATTINLQNSGKKSTALGRVGVAQCKALVKQPKLSQISEAVKMLYAAITTGTENAAASYADLGEKALNTISTAPELATVIVAELGVNIAVVNVQSHKQFTVTFETNGGSTVKSVKVTNGDTLDKPADPTKEDYIFVNWYADAELKTAWNFSNLITEDITLYAKWADDPKIEQEAKASLDAVEHTLAVSFNADGQIAIAWNRNENATGYELIAHTPNGKLLIKNISDNNVTETTTVIVGTAYSVRSYITRNGKSYRGTESALADLVLAKAKISSLKSSKKKQATVKFGKVAGAQTYEIKYKVGNGTWKTVSTSKLSRTFKKLTSKKKLSVKVRGIYAAGELEIIGPWSATKTVKIK